MGTTAKPRGKTANLLFGTQTAFDTAAIGNYISTFFYSENLGESEPFEQSPLIGLARNNNRDATEPQPGLFDGVRRYRRAARCKSQEPSGLRQGLHHRSPSRPDRSKASRRADREGEVQP